MGRRSKTVGGDAHVILAVGRTVCGAVPTQAGRAVRCRPVFRRLFTLASAASLLVCLAAFALCWVAPALHARRLLGPDWSIQWLGGTMVVDNSPVRDREVAAVRTAARSRYADADRRFTTARDRLRAAPARPTDPRRRPADDPELAAIVAEMDQAYRDMNAGATTPAVSYQIDRVTPMAAAAILPAVWLAASAARKRRERQTVKVGGGPPVLPVQPGLWSARTARHLLTVATFVTAVLLQATLVLWVLSNVMPTRQGRFGQRHLLLLAADGSRTPAWELRSSAAHLELADARGFVAGSDRLAYWKLALALGVSSGLCWAARRRVGRRITQAERRRLAEGRCRWCGYDLRGTPGQCPECGAVAQEHARAV